MTPEKLARRMFAGWREIETGLNEYDDLMPIEKRYQEFNASFSLRLLNRERAKIIEKIKALLSDTEFSDCHGCEILHKIDLLKK